MTEIVSISLENEMDLIVANKRTIKIADYFNLSLSAQTTFTTAVSEICREIIEKIQYGMLTLSVRNNSVTWFLLAEIKYDSTHRQLSETEEGLLYARRLMSQFRVHFNSPYTIIELKINIPRTSRIHEGTIDELLKFFNSQEPETPYEEVKRKNLLLNRMAEKQKEQLLHSHYLNEKKSEFLSIASHELKTPLTTIKAFTQLALASDEECGEEIKGYLKSIDRQASKLNLLIQQLLDFSKVENGKLDFITEEVAINQLVRDLFEINRSVLTRHTLLMDLGRDATVRIDKLRIEQVFSNILGNAAKYSPNNSQILISTTLLDTRVRIGVTDQGIGLSPENASKIFDKFYREEESSKQYTGFGMGLYISAQIIKEHKGEIWVESEQGKGATFYFTLPLIA